MRPEKISYIPDQGLDEFKNTRLLEAFWSL
jgi:hypothetical protein